MISIELWDVDTHFAIADWLVKAGRESGSPLLLRLAFAQKAMSAVLAGDLGEALTATAEEEAIAGALGEPPLLHHRLLLAAMRGHREEALELLRAGAAPGGHVANPHWAESLLHNGLADHSAARAATEHGDLFLTGAALPELVEAAVKCHEPAEAARALEELTDRTQAAAPRSATVSRRTPEAS
ncbi:hypothetical protein [Lentzea sp.]|uniref:hypothetical protein n=1 Tax=Lentzea sp. TaxID=56099 RepID=UPI002C5B48C2|nr:hypothetical protein [Lentzea sp.]HUQ62053.1 hypothetical protein [Lentzea sp.]